MPYGRVNFAVLADHKVKIKENEKIAKNLDLAKEQKQTLELEVDGNTNTIWWPWNGLKGFGKNLEELEVRGRNKTSHTTVEISQNTQKSPGELRKLAVTQTPGKAQQLTLV